MTKELIYINNLEILSNYKQIINMAQPSPPYYVLLAHSSLSNPPNTLGHPLIQYHYTDDSPLSLLPNHPDDHVLVLHYDPESPAAPTVQSVSKDLVVTGLRVEEAPGAAVADETGARNSAMFIIETTANDPYVLSNHHGLSLTSKPQLHEW